jgi:hypothetical protein
MFPVRYELGFYIPEGGILHSYRLENLTSYIEYPRPNICTKKHVAPCTCTELHRYASYNKHSPARELQIYCVTFFIFEMCYGNEIQPGRMCRLICGSMHTLHFNFIKSPPLSGMYTEDISGWIGRIVVYISALVARGCRVLRQYATSRKVADSRSDDVIEI